MDIRAVDRTADHGHESANAAGAPMVKPVAVPTSAWNVYQVQFPRGFTASMVRRTMVLPAHGASAIVTNRGTDGLWVDADVSPGQTYDYEWGFLENGVFRAEGTARVQIPTDLVVSGVVDPKSPQGVTLFSGVRWGRLHFEKATVTTQGQALYLHADEIDFNDARVRTFEEGAKAKPGLAGRSGGMITLEAARIRGQARFEMRGEHGGDGLPGAAPTPEMKGAKGGRGADGIGREVRFSKQWANTYHIVECRPEDRPQRGKDGGKGRTGFQGFSGGTGGESGQLIVRTNDRSLLTLNESIVPGRGGAGGAGGRGGEGGDPGENGQLKANVPNGFGEIIQGTEECEVRGGGSKGPEGDQGPVGANGADGASATTLFTKL